MAEEEGKRFSAAELQGENDLPYLWNQTLQEVTLNFKDFPPSGVRAKQLDISFEHSKLRVGVKGKDPITNKPLHKAVRPDDCIWQLDDGKLVIYLSKQNQMEWWKCVCVGDTELDTTKIEPENSKLDDLDAETRKMVEKMMYDQRQKAAGKPTSEEQKQQEMLRQFQEKHPEMDFSKAKFT